MSGWRERGGEIDTDEGVERSLSVSVAYSGDILFGGEVQKFSGIADSEKAGIAIIYQELALIPEMTVYENIFLGHEIKKGFVVDWNETIKQAAEMLKKVRLRREPGSKGDRTGRRETAIDRNRESIEQGCQTTDPRRTDLRSE